MVISIEGIFYTAEASQPMISIEQGMLIQGIGLEGDRYAKKIGTYSVLKSSITKPGEQEPGRQLTLISGDGVREAFHGSSWEEKKIKSMGDLRRNIVLKGISSNDLLNSIGSIIEIGATTTSSDGNDKMEWYDYLHIGIVSPVCIMKDEMEYQD